MKTRTESTGRTLAAAAVITFFALTVLFQTTVTAQGVRPPRDIKQISLNTKPDLSIVEMEYNKADCQIGVLVTNQSVASVEKAVVVVQYSTKDSAFRPLLWDRDVNLGPNESKWLWGSVIIETLTGYGLQNKCYADEIYNVRAAADPRWLLRSPLIANGVPGMGGTKVTGQIISSRATFDTLEAHPPNDKIYEPAIDEKNEDNNELTVTMAAMRKTGGARY